MSDEQQPLNLSSNDRIEAHIGDGASDVIVGKDITSVRAGERGVAVSGPILDSIIITGDNNQVITQRLDPKDAKNQRNHATMRRLVRKFWIDGVLKSSLYNEVLIRLNLTEQPKAVDNRPWDLILQQPGQPNYDIPPGTPIIDVFDQMDGLLLILGEPGSGKTTTLLELADELLKRADVDLTHLTPVVFNLSSWAERGQPLTAWLVDELRTKYNIPTEFAQKWIKNDELLPLLDGLDEVRQDCRDDCVKAINQFRQEHLVPLVVCSRVIEYNDLANQLRLQGAVLAKPLTLAQIDEYLNTAGDELSSVSLMLQEDIELHEMATIPLLLSVMAMTYHRLQLGDIALNSLSRSRRHLFDAYIKRMFVHRNNYSIYVVQQTIHWLTWLAKNMNQRQQTVFLIERLQPDWLMGKLGKNYIFTWLFGGEIKLTEQIVVNWKKMLSIFLAGPIIALLIAVGVMGIFIEPFGLFIAALVGLMLGLTYGLSIGITKMEMSYSSFPNQGIWYSAKNMAIGGLTCGFVGGLLSLLIFRLGNWILDSTLANMKVFGIDNPLTNGLIFGLFIGLIIGVKVSLQTKSLYFLVRVPVTICLAYGLVVSIIAWIDGRIIFEIMIGLVIGLLFGLFEYGGFACFQHTILRTILWMYKQTPLNFANFLDYCHDRIFLRKVGGGYIFIHRMLLEHFASLTDEDIERIAAEVEASRS